MGADRIISGICHQIAQTIAHLARARVVSKATMADALVLALRHLGNAVVDRAPGRLRCAARIMSKSDLSGRALTAAISYVMGRAPSEAV
jgi:hypothetical protein